MSRVSRFGYLEVDQEALGIFEKEEGLDIDRGQLVESQYIYFNSTNLGDVLVYNRLSNTLFRIGGSEIFEYRLPKLYEQEFSDRPQHLAMHVGALEEGLDSSMAFLAYIQEDCAENQKLLVVRKVTIDEEDGDESDYVHQNGHTKTHSRFRWTEVDYIETKVYFENSQILRGVVWWEDVPHTDRGGGMEGEDSSESLSLGCPSILMVTSSKLILFSLTDHGIQPMWQIHHENLRFWYNMEFQCLLLQTGPNLLTPFVNIGMGHRQRPIRLQTLELILDSELRQTDIYLLKIYGSLYCVHADYNSRRISLRDLFNPESPDLVLDIRENIQEFTLAVIDNVIVVISLHGRKMFGLFDIKLVKESSRKNQEDSNNTSETSVDDNNSYYMVPTLFNDEFTDNIIVCNYDSSRSETYKESLSGIRSLDLNNYFVLLLNSSNNIVIKLDLNKIQYSRLTLCSGLLVDSIITCSKNKDDEVPKEIISVEKMDLLPFISNRSQIWDIILLEKLKKLADAEIQEGTEEKGSRVYPKSLTLTLEIIRVKADLKMRVRQEYYDILLELILFFGRESLLQFALQYHIIEDSRRILRKLYCLYLINREEQKASGETEQGRVRFDESVGGLPRDLSQFKIRDVSWLEQVCLDTAYRMNNVRILMEILIYKKEYRRAIRVLRERSGREVMVRNADNRDISIEKIILTLSKENQTCRYPIYNILYELGSDVKLQESDPTLLRDVIKEVQGWINAYFDQVERINGLIMQSKSDPSKAEGCSFYIIGRPNISKCNIWLPDLINLKDLDGNSELISSEYAQGCDWRLDISDSETEKGSLNTRDMKKSSTMESVYVSAAESNETFAVNGSVCERESEMRRSYNNSSSSSITDAPLKSASLEDHLDQRRSSGKSPLLQYEPGILASSSIYMDNSSSDSSSYSSDSSSSFNSYE
ncbi:hypothetical protein OIY81_1666 [Cryptosporidium canis]|uniref:Mic1 domain-containing protein n=1 Tax=Cryptosporidium canis TaxID=195482 RepID=A0ABQ8P4F4_9CRYT|nr:hypothetical protein OJ252_2707 [Cryptosporidium canis]KAJ1611512.1 hypothetical protein OIY81_1666 [Cryptosporidium canis]